ncbi:hypothetical protein OL309_004402 [Vibrio parahaemolyticus]|nr:hypothetical protein [Vibrio parahaemolyticus]
MCTENKKIDPKQYNYACYLLQSGECSTAKEVAEIVDIPVATLRARFRKDGITKPITLRARDLDDTESAKKLKTEYLNWFSALTKRALMFASESTTQKIPLGHFKDDLRALKDITDIANKNYATCSKILKVDDVVENNELPEFRVVEMTASDVEEVRQVQRAQFRELSTTEETESRQ